MKQSSIKQLFLLAVFLFAGIGSAFGQDETSYHVKINKVDASTGSAYPFYQLYLRFSDEEWGVNYYYKVISINT